MSLAMEETTFHVGKPLPSAQSMPEEKGRVSATRAPDLAGGGCLPGLGASPPGPKRCELFTVLVSLCFPRKWGLIEVVRKIR